MSRRNDLVRLRHMLDHAREAVQFGHGKSAKQISKNRKLSLALTRLVEMIGEAASQVSREIQSRYPQIHWSEVIGRRPPLIHGYNMVDYDILADTIRNDLPPLIKELEKIIPKGKK